VINGSYIQGEAHLAFKIESKSAADRLISLSTGSKAVHSELVLPTNNGLGYTSFSASQWDKCVRFKDIDYNNDKKWLVVPMPGFDIFRLYVDAKAYNGLPYDFSGAIMAAFRQGSNVNPKGWYCSKICFHLLRKQGLAAYAKSDIIVPGDLMWIAQQYFEDWKKANVTVEDLCK
jgi:hypothetical protein